MFSRVVPRLCAASASPSVANHVPKPQKNKFMTKMADIYMTKIPTGVREFVIMGPLCLGCCLLLYFLDSILPESITRHMKGGEQVKDIMTYRLEPVYDADTGKLKAYRKVLVTPSEEAAPPSISS